MPGLSTIMTGIFDGVSSRIEGLTPSLKRAQRFRRQNEQQHLSKPIIEHTGIPRLFNFLYERIDPTIVMGGGGNNSYDIMIPIAITYPQNDGWHAAYFGDVHDIYSELTRNPLTIDGLDMCVVEMGEEIVIEPMSDEPWFVGTLRLQCHVTASL